MSLNKRLSAEFIGTFWLVLGGCGTAVLDPGSGPLSVSLAFGLTVLTMAYAIGPISGCHLNPAVSLGLAVGGRFSWREVLPYWIVQVLGAVAAGAILYYLAAGRISTILGNFACNGYGEHSPGRFGLGSAFLCELVMTCFFLVVILGSTSKKASPGFAPIAIGLCLTLIHLISIPVTNTSVNPARSTGVAFFSTGDWALDQLWLFWVAPLIGAALGGFLFTKLEEQ